ncbi:MAG: hypothetical protein JRJ24_08805, partial [Deltaproteobacteria bacterium]|nr:hypothetical protein [Deltaproteobacteria bacterium]
WSIQPLLRLRGHGALGLVAAGEPSLLSPLQSAYELEAERGFSRELVVAQRVGLLRALDASPARKFIPWRWLVQPALAATVLLAALAWWSLDFDRAAAGSYSLLHTQAGEIEGVRTSQVVARTDAELLFPDYMDRSNERVEDADRLIVPRGTAVEYAITPIGAVMSRRTASATSSSLPLSPIPTGRWKSTSNPRSASAGSTIVRGRFGCSSTSRHK